MRVKKISAFVMAVMLVLSPFTLFSFAADTSRLKDSGFPVASTFSLRQSASTFSARAVTLPDAPSGFFWSPVDTSGFEFRGSATNAKEYQIFGNLMPGTYFTSLTLSQNYYRFGVWNTDEGYRIVSDEIAYSSNTGSVEFSLDSPLRILFYGYFDKGEDVSKVSLNDFLLYKLESLPLVESDAISSGYTYSSGIISKSTRSIFNTINANFGSQPAGKYLINIYHWGDSYDVRFQMHDGTERVFYPTFTTGGVTTFVYEHVGGTMTIEGSFTASNDETSVVDGTIYGGGQGDYMYIGGDLTANGSLSWVFNIKDIVAVPYELASDNNFGFFSPIIGFFRDQFNDMKSWIAIQIDKIAGDDQTKATVDNAASELEQEVNNLNTLHGQLDSQASTLEQQFSNDFAVPSEVAGQTSNLQLMYSGIFSSLGVFSIFIWLPVVLAVIKKLLRL